MYVCMYVCNYVYVQMPKDMFFSHDDSEFML